MDAGIIFLLIVIILCLEFVFERVLERLNLRHMSPELPGALKGIYDESEYARFQAYKKEHARLDSRNAVFSFVVLLGFLLSGGFGWYNGLIVSFTGNMIWQTILFVMGLSVVSTILDLPFDYYGTFRIEEKYGFNKTTKKTYWLDTLKSLLLSLILGSILLALLVWFYIWAGTYFWVYAWGAITLFSLFMSMFYSQLIVPLFNKQIPLQQGSLRDKIQEFAYKAGFKLNDIYVIDGSKRSTKANAYFTGLGPKKRIVLYDTLIEELNEEEIVAVLAHEIGHYKKRHTQKSMLGSILQMGVMLWLFSLCVNYPALSIALGGDQAYFQLGLMGFAVLYSPISMILGVFGNKFSRKNEYEADAYAATHYEGKYLISGLEKISVKALSNLTPHPFYERIFYSHPSLLKRIQAINEIH